MERAKINEVIIKVQEETIRKLSKTKRIRIIADCAGGHSAGNHGQKGLNSALRDVKSGYL